MDYTRYSRDVVILEEKDREFADRPGEEMKGYLRVETGNGRGAFRCVMQNVKYYPRSEYTYQLILLGNRGERTIHTVIGTIPVSRYGTGEVYLRFHPNDVDGQGNDYGRYSTAIVAAVSSKNKREPLHPVLMGKTGEKQEERPVHSAAADQITVRRTYNQYYAQYLKHVCEYLWSVPGYYRKIQPFDWGTWLKIDDPDAMFLVSPGARHFTTKFGHFLLGRTINERTEGEEGEECTYYVAVPGQFLEEEQPDGGESGFQQWFPISGESGYGYWVAAIDGQNGEIFTVSPQ
ncbi:MAG: hypothetical protein IJ486_04125 [Firmicutes bacterium]|nr:hypothetical protein [Bacillota bacterium]